MAKAGTQLDMVFKNAASENEKITLGYVDSAADGDDVNTLMDTIVTNGSMFIDPPMSKVSAQIVTTSVRDVEMTDPADGD